MTEFSKALKAFWDGFSYNGIPIKAYLSGQVPQGATFPYITFDVVQADVFNTAILTAIVWCRRGLDGKSVNGQRAAILDDIAAAIPPQGCCERFSGGFMVLTRNSVNFQSYYDDPEDPAVIGGRVSYEVKVYKNK